MESYKQMYIRLRNEITTVIEMLEHVLYEVDILRQYVESGAQASGNQEEE